MSKSDPDFSDEMVLQQVLTMATEGRLGYLALCRCGRWYIRRRLDQQSCTLKCKTQSETFKKHRADYMRNYYKKNFKKEKANATKR
jgi:hypothetical protein